MKAKTKLNFIIDAVMFLLMAAIAGLGFMMKYMMPPGKIRAKIYGGSVDLSFLGLDRHEWGTVHLYLGYALMILLVLHIILHWGMVVGIYRRFIPNGKARLVIVLVFVVVSAFMLLFPFFARPKVIRDGGDHESHSVIREAPTIYSYHVFEDGNEADSEYPVKE